MAYVRWTSKLPGCTDDPSDVYVYKGLDDKYYIHIAVCRLRALDLDGHKLEQVPIDHELAGSLICVDSLMSLKYILLGIRGSALYVPQRAFERINAELMPHNRED
jgi:hypothetical protein